MKKKILLIMLLFLVTACNVDYKLSYDGGEFVEEIQYSNLKRFDLEQISFRFDMLDDPKVILLEGSTKEFDQSYTVDGDVYTLNYKATHQTDDFARDSYLQRCYEKIKVVVEDETIYITAYDGLLQGDCFKNNITASFTSPYRVVSSNADKKDGQTLSWDMTKHQDSVEIVLAKNLQSTNDKAPFLGIGWFKIIFAIAIIVILVPSYIILKKKMED